MPVAGTAVYLLSTPLFPSWEIKSGLTNRTARLIAHNFDGATTNKYIVNATIDGERWTKAWIEHEFFMSGRTLEIWLGPKPSPDFAGKVEDLPPSFSTGGFSPEEYAGRCPTASCSTTIRKNDIRYLFVSARRAATSSFNPIIFIFLVLLVFLVVMIQLKGFDQTTWPVGLPLPRYDDEHDD